MRYRLAKRVREELEQRKRRLAIMTYDDLLTRLNDTLGGPNGPAARERLRSRYAVVLVDEFQDTDPIQWQILHRAFAAEGVTLVLIADPKQAIYAFRGADVYAYLTAAATAGTRATLRENRRSDQALLDAYDALFADARLGHPDIVYRKVRAVARHQGSRLSGAPGNAALRVRVVSREAPGIDLSQEGWRRSAPAREYVARDVAADIVRLLSSGATIGEERVCPRHIAVLVRTHSSAELVRDQLHAARVPAVINGAGSVFATSTAHDWLRLLEAIERPASALRAKTAALTPFLGWSAERVATTADDEWEEVHRRLHRLEPDPARQRRRRADRGDHGRRGSRRPRARDARTASGGSPTCATSAQLLHRAASAERLGVTALRGWLRRADRRRAERGRRGGAGAAARVRRRGGAGADDPSQQGPRVPDRLLPVPVGSELDPDKASRCRSTIRRWETGSRSTSAWRALASRLTRSSSRSSSAARTCASPTSR